RRRADPRPQVRRAGHLGRCRDEGRLPRRHGVAPDPRAAAGAPQGGGARRGRLPPHDVAHRPRPRRPHPGGDGGVDLRRDHRQPDGPPRPVPAGDRRPAPHPLTAPPLPDCRPVSGSAGGRAVRVVLTVLLGGIVVPVGVVRPAALLGAAPAVLWMRYAERRDAGRPEPPGALRRMAVAGALAVVPVAVVELVVNQAYPSET